MRRVYASVVEVNSTNVLYKRSALNNRHAGRFTIGLVFGIVFTFPDDTYELMILYSFISYQ
jgi:hypothetical protein